MSEAKRLRVLLVGEESAGVLAFRFLRRAGAEIVAVLTSNSADETAGPGLGPLARREGVETWPAKMVKDPALGERIRGRQVDLLLNVHSLYLVCPEALAAPRIGAFNLHPGPLPEYAGLNCVSWAIYGQAREYGVTLHWMVPRLDAGPIAYQKRFPLEDSDTPISLGARCVKEGVPLLIRLIETARKSPASVPRLAQDLGRRAYYSKAAPQNGLIDWSKSAREVAAFVRACDYLHFPSPWGRPRARLFGAEAEVLRTELTRRRATAPPGTIGAVRPDGVETACADEWLKVKKIGMAGRILDAQNILNPGDRFETAAAEIRDALAVG